MANTKPCSACDHYDVILRGTKETANGWCGKHSKYPAKDSPGQVTPKNAQRVSDLEAPAEPVIVKGLAVIQACRNFVPKRSKASKADLLAQAVQGNPGKR